MEASASLTATVKSDVAALPRNIFSKVSVLNDRERDLKRFAEKCRYQMLEVQKRSQTLQQYATDLVEMDKQLRAAENQFEEAYDANLSEIADQEEEYLHALARIREEREQIEQRLKSAVQVSSALLNRITETTKEESEIKVTTLNIETLTEKTREQVAQLSLEKLHFEVEQHTDQVNSIVKEMKELQGVVNDVEKRRTDLLLEINATLEKKRELMEKRASLVSTNEAESIQIRNRINDSRREFEDTSNREIRMMGEQSVIQREIAGLAKRIADKRKERTDFDEIVAPNKERLTANNEKLEAIRSETRQYKEALARHMEFLKGIEVSVKRAQLREQEIISDREIIKNQLQKAKIDHFMIEEELEAQEKDEKEITADLRTLESERDAFIDEEEEINEQFSTTSTSLSTQQDIERRYQSIVDEAHQTHRALKDKIEQMRKEEKRIAKKIKQMKQDPIVPVGHEIDEARRRVHVLVKGYETQVTYTRDQCSNLSKAVKHVELQLSVSQSEQRRMNSTLSDNSTIMANSDIMSMDDPVSCLDQRQQERRHRIALLNDEIKDIERRRNDLHAKLAVKRLNVMNKTTDLEHDSQTLPGRSRQAELLEQKATIQKQMAASEELCRVASTTAAKVRESIADWQSITPSAEKSAIKQWFQTISGLIDHTEACTAL